MLEKNRTSYGGSSGGVLSTIQKLGLTSSSSLGLAHSRPTLDYHKVVWSDIITIIN